MRPGWASWIAEAKVAEAASRRWVNSVPTNRVMRRAATTEGGRRQLRGSNRCHPVHQLVPLVHHQQRVFRQHRRFGNGVDGQQRMVGDDDIGPAGGGTRPFGEALRAKRTAGDADTFPRGNADLRPGSIRHTGLEVVTVTGVGRRRPAGEPLHVAPQRGHRHRVEEFLLRYVVLLASCTAGLTAVVDFVQAQVIPPPFEQRELRAARQRLGERIGQPGQIAIDELALQGDRGGRHHDGGFVADGPDNRWNQIRQRLAGARAGLHDQVLAGFEGLRDGGGHLLLAAPFAAVERGHRESQQLGHGQRRGHAVDRSRVRR